MDFLSLFNLEKDQIIGLIIFIISSVGIIIYGWLLFYNDSYSKLVLEITAFLAVTFLLAILAWIGWTMARTPPPPPIEPIASTPSASNKSKSKKA